MFALMSHRTVLHCWSVLTTWCWNPVKRPLPLAKPYRDSPLRSKISRGEDSLDSWLEALNEASSILLRPYVAGRGDLIDTMRTAATNAQRLNSNGSRFIPWNVAPKMSLKQREWFLDPRLGESCSTRQGVICALTCTGTFCCSLRKTVRNLTKNTPLSRAAPASS